MKRRLTIVMMLAPALVAGCARQSEKVTAGTLAELRDVRPDVAEAQVEQFLIRQVDPRRLPAFAPGCHALAHDRVAGPGFVRHSIDTR